jgi:hypothetical protein
MSQRNNLDFVQSTTYVSHPTTICRADLKFLGDKNPFIFTEVFVPSTIPHSVVSKHVPSGSEVILPEARIFVLFATRNSPAPFRTIASESLGHRRRACRL